MNPAQFQFFLQVVDEFLRVIPSLIAAAAAVVGAAATMRNGIKIRESAVKINDSAAYTAANFRHIAQIKKLVDGNSEVLARKAIVDVAHIDALENEIRIMRERIFAQAEKSGVEIQMPPRTPPTQEPPRTALTTEEDDAKDGARPQPHDAPPGDEPQEKA